MEHEIIGHTRKALKILSAPSKSFWEKAKEILIEILIIVFAVTFAAYIERSRESHKEQAEAKEFLTGLKEDLNGEITYLKTSRTTVDSLIVNYTMFNNLKPAQIDSFKSKHTHFSFNIHKFNSQLENGRYDGFKSSGRIQTIANDSLRNDILKLYQEDVPYISFTEGQYNEVQRRFDDLILNGVDTNAGRQFDIIRLLTTPKAKLLLEFSIGYSKGVNAAYGGALEQAEKVKSEITRTYK